MIKEKIQSLYDAMEKDNYDFFDGDQNEAHETIDGIISDILNYPDIVIQMTRMTDIWSKTCEGAEYRENVKSIDRRRTFTHDTAINRLKMLNKLLQFHELEPFDINTESRYEVAEFIGKLGGEMEIDE